MKSRKVIITIVVSTVLLLLAGILYSIYLLLYNNSGTLGVTIPIDTSLLSNPPTPSPTPPYLPYLAQSPSYVGTIEEITVPHQVIIVRNDSSKVILDLKEDIPIYIVRQDQDGNNPEIEIKDITSLMVGDSLSVYTEGKNILAIFILPTPTSSNAM